MNTFLADLASAHQNREGYYKGSLAYRNNNPGNLRLPNGSFRYFPTYALGRAALEADLSAKILGAAASVKRYSKATGIPYDKLTFQDYISIYAPSEDNNDPIDYCNFLCQKLQKYNLHPTTPLSEMAQLIKGEMDRVPDTVPPRSQLTQEQRIEAIKNAIKFNPDSTERGKMLRRLLKRLSS